MRKPTFSIAFANNSFLIRKNYETPEYILLPSMFASPIFDGTRCVLQDTRNHQEFPVSFYKGSMDSGEIFQFLMLDIYGIEGFPILPAPAARTLVAEISRPNAAANVSLILSISGSLSMEFDLYTSTVEEIQAAFNSYLSDLGLAGRFSLTIHPIVNREAISIAATCTDCWVEAMTLTLLNGEEKVNAEFQVLEED